MSDHKLAEALRPLFEKAFMSYYTNGAHLLERFDTGHYRSQEAQAAWRIAREFGKALAAHEAEQQAGEAVAWVDERAIAWLDGRSRTATITTKLQAGKSLERPMPLFTHPQQPLSDEQIEDHRWCWLHGPAGVYSSAFVAGFREAERAHGIGITKDTK